MESNPFRVIPLLGDSSPRRGILFYRYRERSRRRLILEAVLEESQVVALVVACETPENSRFWIKGKIEISIKNPEFF